MNNATAATVVEQLGGNKFLAMTGAKDFVVSETALQFKLGRKSNGGNKVRIALRADDSYAVEFWHVKGTNIFQVGETVEGVQVADLRSVFTSLTGMDVAL